ncbi:hypothetical protein [Winogradskyella sp.]|uniref:hypothetical protein n=1 Tax=Winogradskyella sp. TaxID=1883156 RepID=UPI003AB7CEEA
MKKAILIKKIRSKVYVSKIQLKSLFRKNKNANFLDIDKINKTLESKKSICVVCSGPSANKLLPNKDHFYLVTNDSYKLVKNYDFLYYVGDGYFFRRFLANAPYCRNHKHNIFFFRKEDQLHAESFEYFKKHSNLLSNNSFLLSNFENNFKHSNANYKKFIDFLEHKNIPVKFQNSGVFLLMFGFYLAVTYKMKLEIYGLDLGMGGNVHFDNAGHVGKSITNDRVKVNTKKQLNIIYNILNENVSNYSFFHTKNSNQ